MELTTFRIDPEFKSLIPPLSVEEYAQLEANILRDGCRDPLVTWDGVLIDGHNRYEICTKHDIDFDAIEHEFDSREEALIWIEENQLGRRNLTPDQIALLLGRKYNRQKKSKAEAGAIGGLSKDQNDTCLPYSTAEKIAAQHGVSPATVKRAGQFADAVEKINEVSPGFTNEVISGSSLPRQEVVEAAAVIEEIPQEIVAKGAKEILAAAKQIRAERTEQRRAERVEKLIEISRGNAPLHQIAEKFPVIYADPPWRYEHSESESRAIENQYPTMSLDEIKSLPLGDIATDDCILFMWATSPKLAESMEVLSAWGFTYRTCAVWDKQKIGMGYYFRQQHELLLVATKGNPPTPLPANRPASVFSFPRGEHSAKPVEVYEIIESMYGELPKLEMFCRGPREGWGVWGNQSEVR